MSIFGKIFDVVGDFGSDIYSAGKSAVSGAGSAVSNVFTSKIGKGVANAFAPVTGTLGAIGGALGGLSAIGNLVSDKDSGQGSPLGAFTGLQTNQSSIMGANFLAPFGTTGLSLANKYIVPFASNKASQALGLLGGLATSLIGDDDNNQTGGTTLMPDPMISFAPNVQTMPQMGTGNAFFSPVLGRIGISSKGNIIITRRLKNQFKALADNVGLAQASNLAGVPLEIGAMILTKRFATRGKSISTKKMQECARTYKRITNFYNMIPRRTATRTTRAKSMRGASTVIQNS